MRIDPAGLPFIGGALALALIAGVGGSAGLAAAPFVVLAGVLPFFLFATPSGRGRATGTVLSPADGRVLVAGAAVAAAPPDGTGSR